MSYTVYERKTTRTHDIAVTITTAGRFALNAAASRLLHKHGVEAVLLMSDRDRRKLAIKQIGKKDKRSYSISYGQDLGGASLSAKSFLDDIGWDGKKYNVTAVWNEEQSLLEFDMPEWKKEGKQKIAPVEHTRRQQKIS